MGVSVGVCDGVDVFDAVGVGVGVKVAPPIGVVVLVGEGVLVTVGVLVGMGVNVGGVDCSTLSLNFHALKNPLFPDAETMAYFPFSSSPIATEVCQEEIL